MLHPNGIYTDEKDEVYSYLFFNTTDLRPFYIIEKEMKQLNSYCELTIRSTKTKTEEMKSQLKDFQSGNIKEEQKYEDSEYPVDWDLIQIIRVLFSSIGSYAVHSGSYQVHPGCNQFIRVLFSSSGSYAVHLGLFQFIRVLLSSFGYN